MSLLLLEMQSAARAPRESPERIHVRRWTRNGLAPDVTLYNQQAVLANHVAAYMGREVFCLPGGTRYTSNSGSTAITYRFKTGPGTRFIHIKYVMGRDASGTGADPRVTFTFTPQSAGAGTLTSTFTVRYGKWNGAAYTYHSPDSLITRDRLVSVYPDREYELTIQMYDNGSLVCATGVERCTYANSIVDTDYLQHSDANPQDEAGWPYVPERSVGDIITDADRSRLARSAIASWDHGATIASCWLGVDTTVAANSTGHLLTGGGSDIPLGHGWDCSNIDQYRARSGTGFIKLKLRVYGAETAPYSGTTIALVSEAGGDTQWLISTSITGGLAWYEATAYEHSGALAAGGWGAVRPVAYTGSVSCAVLAICLEIEGS